MSSLREWGGIWDHAVLRHWATNSVSDVFVYPLQPEQVVWGAQVVELLVNVTLHQPAVSSFAVKIDVTELSIPANPISSSSVTVNSGAQSTQLTLSIMAPKLWSPDTPALYVATASWGDGATFNSTFGIRHLTTRGAALLLNGAALYVHGVGDDYTYMETEAPPL
eukprot:SAG22_NODE_5966_length_924_cov_1.014545_2_plen_164_part_01